MTTSPTATSIGMTLAVVVELAFADGDDLALLGLLLGGVRDDQTALGLLLGLARLDDHSIVQRLEIHSFPPISIRSLQYRRGPCKVSTLLIFPISTHLALPFGEC